MKKNYNRNHINYTIYEVQKLNKYINLYNIQTVIITYTSETIK
ncbi:hypothetical protein PXD04_08785 [Methanosphaera sp. ISO3-F5]|nr:hypothetical protein [Methanosphaera sp. ISO3-F5]WQH63785.1 hypothetical protein PXD04_08785 [Methanosphaera sp. ISO3-F5]